jgi:cardiolipin synthase A/B
MNFYEKAENLSLIVQPGDSFFPVVDAIDSATRSIRMTVFRMDDPVVRDALSYAVQRGVRVQALVAPAAKGWNKRNRKLAEDLTRLGIEVRITRPRREKLKRYHYKIMMIDERQSLIMTFNPTKNNMHYARDFGLVIRDPLITTELNRLFDADWHGKSFKPDALALVVSPYNSRERLAALLESAERSIHIMDAKVEDRRILSLLLHKATRGIGVRVIGRNPFYEGVVKNFQMTGLPRFKLHAKCIIVDHQYVFIGSQNLRKVSLDHRREVGMLIRSKELAHRIERVFEMDWSSASERMLVEALPAKVGSGAAILQGSL